MRHGIGLVALALLAPLIGVLAASPAAGDRPPGRPDQLLSGMPEDAIVWSFELAPDGTSVVFIANLRDPELFELFSVPMAGGAGPTRLSADMVPGGGVQEFTITPDASHAIYWADQDVDDVYELYSVSLRSGAVARLNAPLVTEGDVHTWQMSPDSSTIVYLADQDADEVFELYSVPTIGGTPVKLNQTLSVGGGVQEEYSITSDSSRVVLVADVAENDLFELFSVPIDGGPPVKLNLPLQPTDDVLRTTWITPDGITVVYSVDTPGSFELYTVPTIGGPSTRLGSSDQMFHPSRQGAFDRLKISNDGRWVVFQDYDLLTRTIALVVASIEGERSGSYPTLGSPRFELTADSTTLVYGLAGFPRTYEGSDAQIRAVPLAGGTPRNLTPWRGTDGETEYAGGGLTLTPDPSSVLYDASTGRLGHHLGWFLVPVDGGAPVRVDGRRGDGRSNWLIAVSPDSERTLWWSFEDGRRVIVSAPTGGGDAVVLTGRENPVQLNRRHPGPLVRFGPESRVAVYHAFRDGRAGLYKVDLGYRCGGEWATLVGTSGPDTLVGTDGPDVIVGLGGADRIDGGAGRDRICGGGGRDQITGGPGRDIIRGQRGDDTIRGGGGSDRLFGGAGRDLLFGGNGNDTCRGGAGRDQARSCATVASAS